MTDKEKDAVWRWLPEDIKEEIATDYSNALQAYSFDPNNARIDAHIKFLEEYFGTHNLTAEKEEKPKFKVGGRIVFGGRTAKITEIYPDNPDRVFVVFDDNGLGGVFGVEYIEPYTEQEPKIEPDIHLKDEKSEFKASFGNNPYISMTATLSADEIRKAEEEMQKSAAEHLDRINHPEKEYTYEVTLDKVRADESKSEPKHGEINLADKVINEDGKISIPVTIDYDESIWLPYRMELAKEVVKEVMTVEDISDYEQVAYLTMHIVDSIVERLKGEK